MTIFEVLIIYSSLINIGHNRNVFIMYNLREKQIRAYTSTSLLLQRKDIEREHSMNQYHRDYTPLLAAIYGL